LPHCHSLAGFCNFDGSARRDKHWWSFQP
jgi:hypothetical protein